LIQYRQRLLLTLEKQYNQTLLLFLQTYLRVSTMDLQKVLLLSSIPVAILVVALSENFSLQVRHRADVRPVPLKYLFNRGMEYCGSREVF